MSETRKIGVVLSSGGVRGVYAHTGFLLALNKLGVPISAGAGCSAGAIVGGIVASGTDISQWADTLSHVSRDQFWTPDSLWRFLWQMTVRRGTGYTGLSDTSAGLEFCRRNLDAKRLEDCQYPFHIVAVSLGQGKKVVFSEGEMAPRMIASAAMPILYRPVEIDGDLYSDGALIDIAPMDAICCKLNLDVLIIHHTSQRYNVSDLGSVLQKPWSMIELLNRMFYHRRPWYLSDDSPSFHKCPCGCDAVIVVIEPELPAMKWPLTEGGARIQSAAQQQAVSLLQPYLDRLLKDPGKLLQ